MHTLNYGLKNTEYIFFNTTIRVLLEAPIREVTGSTNPGDYWMCQSEILSEAPIREFTGFYNPE